MPTNDPTTALRDKLLREARLERFGRIDPELYQEHCDLLARLEEQDAKHTALLYQYNACHGEKAQLEADLQARTEERDEARGHGAFLVEEMDGARQALGIYLGGITDDPMNLKVAHDVLDDALKTVGDVGEWLKPSPLNSEGPKGSAGSNPAVSVQLNTARLLHLETENRQLEADVMTYHTAEIDARAEAARYREALEAAHARNIGWQEEVEADPVQALDDILDLTTTGLTLAPWVRGEGSGG